MTNLTYDLSVKRKPHHNSRTISSVNHCYIVELHSKPHHSSPTKEVVHNIIQHYKYCGLETVSNSLVIQSVACVS